MEEKTASGREQLRYEIRAGRREEWQDAMALAWRTFLRYEAPDYTDEGVRNFCDFVTDQMLYRMFVSGFYPMFVAVRDDSMIGMITLRNENLISLLFVDEKYQRRGVGDRLIAAMKRYLLKENRKKVLRVNAAPSAVGFYRKLGFAATAEEICEKGIRYTPMELTVSGEG